MSTPAAFFNVIGSFNTNAANNMTATGVIAAIMEIFTGEVYRSALANESCAPTKPKRAPKNIVTKSRLATCSFLLKSPTLQKMRVAKDILTKVKAYGLIQSGTIVLAMGVFRPKIKLVASMAK